MQKKNHTQFQAIIQVRKDNSMLQSTHKCYFTIKKAVLQNGDEHRGKWSANHNLW